MESRPIILFVDDDPMLLASTRRRFASLADDWELHFAESGQMALEISDRVMPTAVVTDMRMPDMDGAVLLTEIQRRVPDSIRIILSGQTNGEELAQAHVVAHTILRKPCETETICNLLRQCFSMRQRLANPTIRKLIASNASIPASPTAISEILVLLRAPEMSIDHLTMVIRSDLGLYAYIIKLINSSHYGMRSRIHDIDQAIMLLGVSALRAIFCGLKLANSLSPKIEEHLCADVFDGGMRLAHRVLRLANHHGKSKLFADDCYIAALFQDFGQLVFAACFGNEYTQLLARAKASGESLSKLEQVAYQCTHAVAGAYLLTLWSFSPQIVECICQHEDTVDAISREPRTVEEFVRHASQNEVRSQ